MKSVLLHWRGIYLIPLYFVVFAGIYKGDGPFDVMIDITQIKELHAVPSTSEVCKPLQYFNLILERPVEVKHYQGTGLRYRVILKEIRIKKKLAKIKFFLVGISHFISHLGVALNLIMMKRLHAELFM